MPSIGAWQPDSAGVDTGFLIDARGAYPTPIGYGPIPTLTQLAIAALPSKCVGLTYARKVDGSWLIFAGTQTKLYKLVAGVWTDYTRSSGGDYNVASGDQWSFTQFGSNLIAVQVADDPQVLDVDSADVNFAALGGSPPKARYVGVVGDFCILAGLATAPRKWQNSSINNCEEWTVGTNLGDEQEFPDGDRITGFVGGRFGIFAQEKAIRRLIFQPGNDQAFRIEDIDKERGCAAGYSLVARANAAFLLADDGFYMVNGEQVLPIGSDRVNQWFAAHCDTSRIFQIQGFADPYATRIYWAFYSSTSLTRFDQLIFYDWKLDKWGHAAQSAQVWGVVATPATGLDSISGSIDDLPASLDSTFWQGGRPLLGAIDTNGVMSALQGATPMDAYFLECERHLGGGHRVKIAGGVYPQGVFNDSDMTVSVGRRERSGAAQTWTAATEPSSRSGWARMIASGRLHQMEFEISHSSGTVWEHFQGYTPDFVPDGRA